MSTTQLTRLPSSFAAGTTVRYRRTFSDYPASDGGVLTLHLAGAKALSIDAVADEDAFDFVIPASTSALLAAGLYKWEERIAQDGDVHVLDSDVVTITPDLSAATDGSQQDWIERAIVALKAHIEGRLPEAMENFQVANRAVSMIPTKEAIEILGSLESRLARISNPEFVTRPVLVDFTGTGIDR
jgi:hypothetical protein